MKTLKPEHPQHTKMQMLGSPQCTLTPRPGNHHDHENSDPRVGPQTQKSYENMDTAYQNMTPAPISQNSHDNGMLHPSFGADTHSNGRRTPTRVEDVELGNMNPAYSDHTGEHTRPQVRPRTDSVASSTSYRSSNLDVDEILERERIASSLQDPDSVLSMLPSRQMGHTINRAKSSNKWLKTQRQRSTIRRGTINRQQSMSFAIRKDYENQDVDRVVEQILADDKENEARTTLRRRQTIRQISSGMSTKRRIRKRIEDKENQMEQVNRSQSRQQADKSLGLCTAWWYQLTYNWESFKERVANWTYTLELWRHSIKTIEGNFGSGVVSYFLLLKWLLLLNIPVFILSFCFIFVPQLFYAPSAASNNATFEAGDLLTGGGWFENTELYYGYYTNDSLRFGENNHHYYSIPFAYLLTNGAYFLLILVVLAVGTSGSYRDYFITGDKKYNYYVAKVFCGWDYSITAPNTAELKKKSIYLELAEHLSQHHAEKKKTFGELFGWVLLRSSSNIFVLSVIAAAAFLIFYMYEDIVIDSGFEVLDSIAVPLVITGYNLLLPYMFSAIGRLERYDNPRNQLYMSLFRTFLMKAAILIVLLYFWLKPCNRAEACPDCWETYVGMEIYKLVLLDFIVQSLATFFLEFIRRIGRDRCCHGFAQPEFDIARNTMDLIQAQTYTWIGMYFSPLLMIFCIVKLVLLFYVKKISVLANCKPSLQPWRAGLAKTTFLIILVAMYAICAGAVGYSLSEIRPSANCGPFRGVESPFDIVVELIESWNDSAWAIIIEFVSTPGFVAAVIMILCLTVYYFRVLTQGRQQTVKQLKQQIILEGKDKRFLLKMLQDAVRHRKGEAVPNDRKPSADKRRRRKKDDEKPTPAKKKGKGKRANNTPVRAAPDLPNKR
ncbi:transmembrane channel-like protein 7 isoform X2 [Amphiura filiformis]|uniref:transmembrane channel-like protein 7 isoform X2 n=1 Tax=Amphiura filiformis TaxID=82378 RepID=UPI003B21837A